VARTAGAAAAAVARTAGAVAAAAAVTRTAAVVRRSVHGKHSACLHVVCVY
jgi:hypothetical protein